MHELKERVIQLERVHQDQIADLEQTVEELVDHLEWLELDDITRQRILAYQAAIRQQIHRERVAVRITRDLRRERDRMQPRDNDLEMMAMDDESDASNEQIA